MSDDATSGATRTKPTGENGTPPDVELDVLREENEQLRQEFARARRSQYRRTAILLIGVGLLTAIAGMVFSTARTVLIALGGSGVFLGILTYYLTPERFVPASIGRDIYETIVDNESILVQELGLRDERVYVPGGEGTTDVRLFVPGKANYEVPDSGTLQDIFVVTENESERGISLRPTGTGLINDFERGFNGDKNDLQDLGAGVTSALVEQFELVDSAEVDIDAASGRLTMEITDSTFGPVDNFDHPVSSLPAVALSRHIDVPITVETTIPEEGADTLITYRWDTTENA